MDVGVSDSLVCGIPLCTYVIKFGYFSLNLSLVDLILRSVERTLKGRGRFLPHPPESAFNTSGHVSGFRFGLGPLSTN